jgi:hypothetical protein
MRFWAVVVGLTVGCASARGVHVNMTVQGSAAGPAEQQRCLAAAQQAGAIVDGNASVQALVTLDKDGNRLQVVSMRRGLVRDEKRSAGNVEALCRDAVMAAAASSDAPTMDGPTQRFNGPSQPAPGTTSGNEYHGPISE